MSMIKEKAIRKNITLSASAAKNLTVLSTKLGLPQSRVINELIEERSEELKKASKLEALKSIKGVATGVFGEKKLQGIRKDADAR